MELLINKKHYMKKNILFYILTTLSSISAYSQIGIGTTSPQGVLHIDAAKNTTVGTPISNVNDDVIIDVKGNIGIGTMPATYLTKDTAGNLTVVNDIKLNILSATPGAIKIVDGTQLDKRVLVSDANGVGTWQKLRNFTNVESGTVETATTQYPNPTLSSSSGPAYKYSNTKIVLSEGRWLINSGLTIMVNNNSSTNNVNTYWLNTALSDDPASSSLTNGPTTFSYVGNAQRNFGGNMIKGGNGNFNFITGSTVIDVHQDNTTVYLMIQNVYTDPSDTTKTISWNFNSGNLENYFYAIPTN